MPHARKFGGLPTLTQKEHSPFRKTLSPPHIPTSNISPLLGNDSSLYALRTVRRMYCYRHHTKPKTNHFVCKSF